MCSEVGLIEGFKSFNCIAGMSITLEEVSIVKDRYKLGGM